MIAMERSNNVLMIHEDRELAEWLDLLVKSDGFFFDSAGQEASKPSSREIFLSFVKYPFAEDGTQMVDCRGVISAECYNAWLKNRSKSVAVPEESFRKALLAHITCADKSSAPFPVEVEASLVNLLKEKRVWPCFENKLNSEGKLITIGKKGLRCRGYHQKINNGCEHNRSRKRSLSDSSSSPTKYVKREQ